MAHPQSSPRGLWAKARLDLGANEVTYNSTAVRFSKGVALSGQATVGLIKANSTAILLPSTGFQMASLTSLIVTSNSTGIKIGARYISTNTTGNATT